MFALRTCAVVVVCALGVGCFLDESPGKVSITPKVATGVSEYVPREPLISTSRAVPATTDASTSNPASTGFDAAMQVQSTTGAARASIVLGNPDAHVERDDASVQPTRDAEVAQPTATAFVGVPPSPIHRYDFSGQASVAIDSIGRADGELRGGTHLDGSGAVQFVRSADDVVALPSGLLSGLSAFTIIGWLELRSDDCWQHLVDFTYYNQQPTQGGRNQSASQMSALYLTPRGCPDGFPIAGYVTDQGRSRVTGDQAVGVSRRLMLGMMYESTTRLLSVIVDGVVRSQDLVSIDLRELARSSCELGRSYYPDDPTLNGSISELRIYAQALDAATLAELARRGPDQL